NLVGWKLEIAPAGTEQWTLVASGASPVTNDALGTLLPTLLADDVYHVRLTGMDRNHTVSAEIEIVVKTVRKPGAFTLSYEDFRVPAPGAPLEVRRIYDSKRLGPGDFGRGWTLGYSAIDVRLDANDNVFVTLSDGRRTAFAFTPVPVFLGFQNRYSGAAG